MIRFAQILGVFLILTSCGSGSSFNQIFVTSEDKNRTDSLFLQAKAAFDNGNFDEAIEKLNKATERDKTNQEYARLKAWALFGKIDLIPVSLMKKLVIIGNEKKSRDTSTVTADDALQDLVGLISLTDEDFKLLGTEDKQEANSILSPYPVIHPYTMEGETNPRVTVKTLRYLDQALRAVCGFVDQDLLDEDSFRYGEGCDSSLRGKASASTNALFAFGHLLEAVAYRKVLLYNTTQSATEGADLFNLPADVVTNVAKRAEAIKNFKFNPQDPADAAKFDTYLEANLAVSDDFARIYDVGSEASMLRATLNGLRIGVSAFKKIPGLPSSMTSSLEAGLTALENSAANLPGGGDAPSAGAVDQTKELKKQMNAQTEKKMNEAIKNANLTPAQTTELCQKLKEKNDAAEKLGGSAFLPDTCDN